MGGADTFEVRDEADTQKNVALASVATCEKKMKCRIGPAGLCRRAQKRAMHRRSVVRGRAKSRTAFARRVFPVPGGPNNSNPRGGALRPCTKRARYRREPAAVGGGKHAADYRARDAAGRRWSRLEQVCSLSRKNDHLLQRPFRVFQSCHCRSGRGGEPTRVSCRGSLRDSTTLLHYRELI